MFTNFGLIVLIPTDPPSGNSDVKNLSSHGGVLRYVPVLFEAWLECCEGNPKKIWISGCGFKHVSPRFDVGFGVWWG
ncbi:hypothetical protein CMUST_10050 [Corynebacterium mustelae]|uniref:Uncharacterized protein n=1 Tax=Corynebacterium mustelae TaxID=571915 RepID=A0A0G3GYU0_9CORY|nr:hypothetical protein CMUST_10050 [Corynebacterium mustelae]